MKKVSVLIGLVLTLAAQVSSAQTPAAQDTSSIQQTQPTQPPPAATPTQTPPAPKPRAARYGSISGSWLMPTGDFENIAGDGWAITIEGYQFLAEGVAFGSQVGYQSFGEKNGISVSNFPVDAVLKVYPRPGTGKLDLYVTGGLGFNYYRTEVGFSSSSDYYFGTQAGAGVELHTAGPISLVVDAVYHWIFASGVDANFIALRGGLEVPLSR
jgi:hypothetical protein